MSLSVTTKKGKVVLQLLDYTTIGSQQYGQSLNWMLKLSTLINDKETKCQWLNSATFTKDINAIKTGNDTQTNMPNTKAKLHKNLLIRITISHFPET